MLATLLLAGTHADVDLVFVALVLAIIALLLFIFGGRFRRP